jgi:homoserine dehydrogenase
LRSNIAVLKFGSSVLGCAADLDRVVDEIFRHVREGRRVVAVVSAFAGETDRLLAEAARYGERRDGYATAALLAIGEQTTAALLALALDQSGIVARMLHPRELGLLAEGDPLDSVPVELDRERVLSALTRASVLVVPGFIAVNRQGRTVLLGRGGSDLSAVFIAERLQAECILIKDVDGLYVSDPALPGPPPARYCAVSWEEALRVGGELVQPKAIEWARRQRWPFDIAGFGSAKGTHVNDGQSFAVASDTSTPLRVVLLGLGTVGRGVYERLLKYPRHFVVEKVLVRHPAKHVAAGVPAALLTTDAQAAIAAQADVVVEALCAGEPALGLTLAALASGKRVVTANKSNVAAEWPRLRRYSRGDDPALRFSAAVGGAVPVLEVIESLRVSANVVHVRAVLNGTCNFVLERMHAGAAYGEALEEAQAQGFAEANPQLDVSGQDAASKLTLIALKVFGAAPDLMERQGIDRLSPTAVEATRPSTSVIKLVATVSLKQGRIVGRVVPELLRGDDYLSGARFEENRFELSLESGERVFLSGRGAGRWPTATSVMGDVWSLARSRRLRDTA